MGPTNQEASGQEKRPLPPEEKECGGRDEQREEIASRVLERVFCLV